MFYVYNKIFPSLAMFYSYENVPDNVIRVREIYIVPAVSR